MVRPKARKSFRIALYLALAVAIAPAWHYHPGAAGDFADIAGLRSTNEPGSMGEFPSEVAGRTLTAEMKEEEGYILYRSGPSADELEDLREKEKEREERSWEMLRNLVIIEKDEKPPVRRNQPVPPPRVPLAPH